jgi:hypothetical protein
LGIDAPIGKGSTKDLKAKEVAMRIGRATKKIFFITEKFKKFQAFKKFQRLRVS